jgi:hypothetical protein
MTKGYMDLHAETHKHGIIFPNTLMKGIKKKEKKTHTIKKTITTNKQTTRKKRIHKCLHRILLSDENKNERKTPTR